MITSGRALRRAIRNDLRSAQREHDVDRVRLYHALLAAVEDAEAVDAARSWDQSQPAPGETEATRRYLDAAGVRELLTREIDDRRRTATQYRDGGMTELAARLDADGNLIAAYLDGA